MKQRLQKVLHWSGLLLLLVVGIAPLHAQQAEEYGVKIGDRVLTPSSYEEVLKGYSGLTFDPAQRVLQFDGVHIRNTAFEITKPLTLKLMGEENLIEWTQAGGTPLFLADIRVAGPGSLRMRSNKGVGLRLGIGATMTLDDGATLYVEGKYRGLAGALGGELARVNCPAGTLYAFSYTGESVAFVRLEENEASGIRYPEGATQSPDGQVLDAEGEPAQTPVMVSSEAFVEYGVRFLNLDINSATQAFSLGEQVQKKSLEEDLVLMNGGVARYEAASKSLILEDVIVNIDGLSQPVYEVVGTRTASDPADRIKFVGKTKILGGTTPIIKTSHHLLLEGDMANVSINDRLEGPSFVEMQVGKSYTPEFKLDGLFLSYQGKLLLQGAPAADGLGGGVKVIIRNSSLHATAADAVMIGIKEFDIPSTLWVSIPVGGVSVLPTAEVAGVMAQGVLVQKGGGSVVKILNLEPRFQSSTMLGGVWINSSNLGELQGGSSNCFRITSSR